MTRPFAIPPIRDQGRPVRALLTLEMGDGQVVVMQIRSPMVDVDYQYDRADVVSWGAPVSVRDVGFRTARVTLEGYFEEPTSRPRRAAPPAKKPAPAVPAVSAAPGLDDLPGLVDLGMPLGSA